MAPTWLSLDRAPASIISLRPKQQATHLVSPFVLRPWTTVVVSAAAAHKRRLVIAVAAATKMASGEERPTTFIEEMRAIAVRLHSKDQATHGEREVPLEPPIAMWEPNVQGFIRFLVDSKLIFEAIEAIVDRAAIPWCKLYIFFFE